MRTLSIPPTFVAALSLPAVFTVLLPVVAAAQEPAASFDRLNGQFKPGVTAWMASTEAQGVVGRALQRMTATAARTPVPAERERFRTRSQARRNASAASGRQPAQGKRRTWISRHPVWFGTIVGAVAGTAIVGATEGSEAAFVGFWGGAAAGAVGGFVVSKTR